MTPQKSSKGSIIIQNDLETTTENGGLEVKCTPKKKHMWHEVDGRFGWVQVFAAGIAFFFLAGVMKSFSLIYEHLIDKYGRSDSVTSWVPSVCGTVRMCTSPLVSLLIQRFNERTVCFFGAVTASVALGLTAVSPSIEFVFLFYGIVYGFSNCCCMIACQTNIAKYFDKKRGRAMAIVFTNMSLGGLVLSPVVQLLFDEFNYVGAMLILSALVSHICLSAVLMRPLPVIDCDKFVNNRDASHSTNPELDRNYNMETTLNEKQLETNSCEEHSAKQSYKFTERPQNDSVTTDSEAIYVSSSHGNADSSVGNLSKLDPIRVCSKHEGESIKVDKSEPYLPQESKKKSPKWPAIIKSLNENLGVSLLRNHTFAIFCSFMTFFLMCVDISFTFQAVLIREKGYSEAQIVTSLILINVVDLPFRFVSGYMYDHRTLRNYKMSMSVILFSTAALFQLLLPFGLDFSFILGMVFLGISVAARSAIECQCPNIIATLVGTHNFAAAFGLSRFFKGIGLLISSPLGGFLKDVTGTYASGYIVMTSLLLLQTVLFFIVKGMSHFAHLFSSQK